MVTKITTIILALVLLFSLGLHSVQTDHAHYGSSAIRTHTHTHTAAPSTNIRSSKTGSALTEIGEKMHMAEKKMALFVLGATLFFFAAQLVQWIAYQRIQYVTYGKYNSYRRQSLNILYSYLLRFFSLGILNPKLY